VAWPVEFRVPVPSVAPFWVKVTVPVGVIEPVDGVTVAVKVTDVPEVVVVGEAVTVVVVVVAPVISSVALAVLAANVVSPP